LSKHAGPNMLAIVRVSQAYMCKVQGCSVRFSQLRQLK
jgi:hypothetical protein